MEKICQTLGLTNTLPTVPASKKKEDKAEIAACRILLFHNPTSFQEDKRKSIAQGYSRNSGYVKETEQTSLLSEICPVASVLVYKRMNFCEKFSKWL